MDFRLRVFGNFRPVDMVSEVFDKLLPILGSPFVDHSSKWIQRPLGYTSYFVIISRAETPIRRANWRVSDPFTRTFPLKESHRKAKNPREKAV